MSVYIRADSSFQIGTGHVVRCLNLALKLKDKTRVSFITRPLKGNINNLIRNQGITALEISVNDSTTATYEETYNQDLEDADFNETAKILESDPECKILIIDNYKISQRWEELIKKKFPSLFIFVVDDLRRKHTCDALLDQNFYLEKNPYENLIPKSALAFVGPEFAMINESFNQRKNDLTALKTITLYFGGDPLNFTKKVLQGFKLAEKFPQINFNIILNQSHPLAQDYESLSSKNVKFLIQLASLKEVLMQTDLLISAGGTISWEKIYLRLPSICIAVAKNQILNAKNLEQSGIHTYLGLDFEVTKDQLINAIEDLKNNFNKCLEMQKCCDKIKVSAGFEKPLNLLKQKITN